MPDFGKFAAALRWVNEESNAERRGRRMTAFTLCLLGIESFPGCRTNADVCRLHDVSGSTLDRHLAELAAKFGIKPSDRAALTGAPLDAKRSRGTGFHSAHLGPENGKKEIVLWDESRAPLQFPRPHDEDGPEDTNGDRFQSENAA